MEGVEASKLVKEVMGQGVASYRSVRSLLIFLATAPLPGCSLPAQTSRLLVLAPCLKDLFFFYLFED